MSKSKLQQKINGKITGILEKMSDRLTLFSHRISAAENLIKAQTAINTEITDSLYKLRDSTQESFDHVGEDVKSLIGTDKRQTHRINEVEAQNLILQEENKLLRVRLDVLDAAVKKLQQQVDGIFYFGYKVYIDGSKVIFRDQDKKEEFFSIMEPIENIKAEPWNGCLLVETKYDRYAIMGGPTYVQMYIQYIGKKA